MKEELYDNILEHLFDTLGYKCQPSELQTLAEQIVGQVIAIVRESLENELQ